MNHFGKLLSRQDYVFSGLESHHAIDLPHNRMAAALRAGGVTLEGQVYLATFQFRASSDTRGTFHVGLVPRDGVLLLDSNGRLIQATVASTVTISLP